MVVATALEVRPACATSSDADVELSSIAMTTSCSTMSLIASVMPLAVLAGCAVGGSAVG
jgi:hypothetical protein